MIVRHEIVLDGTAETDATDVTERVAAFVVESGVRDGLCVVFVPGSTAAVTTIEFIPVKNGEIVFTCGMEMVEGKLVVK